MSTKRCRICLCRKPRRDLIDLDIVEGSTVHPYEEVILFCLNIKVDEDTKLGTKLCVKCHRKILDFYDFKTMAIKNNTIRNDPVEHKEEPEVYVKEVKIKREVSDEELPNEETYKIKTEEQLDNNVQDDSATDEIELEFKDPSDAEVSLIESIKKEGENIPENTYNAKSTPIVVIPSCMKRKTNNTIETCPQCGLTVQDLKRHLVTHLTPEEKQMSLRDYKAKSSGFCKECGIVVNRLQDHMVMHLPENIWKKQKRGAGLAGTCKVCGKTVKRLKKHMVIHLPEYQRVAKKLPEPVKGKKKGPVKCLMCSREFVAQQYLDLHMKNLHLRPKKQCPVCDKKVNKLKMHMLTAHNRDQLRFECDMCGARHATRYILEKHIAIHMNDRPFQCNDCDKKFVMRSALVMHQRQVHLKIRPYLCQFCSKTYCTGAALKIHVRAAHTKERPFNCPDCGKAFYTKHYVKIHRNQVHSIVKNFPCTHCPKRYKSQMEVNRHYREVHLKIKDFKCRFCESRFFRASHLKRHVNNIHLRYAPDKADN